MTTVLAIDTSGSNCTAGLISSGQIYSKSSDSARHGAQEILDLVDDVRQKAGIDLKSIEGIVALTGPGSFTGLRIGIGAAQGLGASLSIPNIGVSTLAFEAWLATRQNNLQHWLVAQSARDQEVYFGTYKVNVDTGFERIGPEQVGSVDTLSLQHVKDIDAVEWGATGAGWGDVSNKQGGLPVQADFYSVQHQDSIGELCRLGVLLLEHSPGSSELLLPNYVKEQMDYS